MNGYLINTFKIISYYFYKMMNDKKVSNMISLALNNNMILFYYQQI